MDIKNVKINEYQINYKNSKFENIINENKHLIPELNKKSITFDLINSNEAFANGIRRTFNDELLVKSLDINIYDLKTDDKYILPDNIIERINLIPILQNINDDLIFSINVLWL